MGNVLPEIDDVVDWVEDWVVDDVDNVADEVDGNVDGVGDRVVSVGLSKASFCRISFIHGNI